MAMTGRAVLYTIAAVLLAVVILAPAVLSSQDLIRWAGTGLGLRGEWRLLVFIALDAAAVVCIVMSIITSWRGEEPGAFGGAVWLFAGLSAYANYRHGDTVRAAYPDVWWFFPAMSLLGPFLLELVLGRIRQWIKEANEGKPHMPWYVRVLRWLLAPIRAGRAFRIWVLNHPGGVALLDPDPEPTPPPARRRRPAVRHRPAATRKPTLTAVTEGGLAEVAARRVAETGRLPANRAELRGLLGVPMSNARAAEIMRELRDRKLVAA